MPLTDDIYLPTDEELAHKEIPLTHNYMLASAMWLGKYCDKECKDFMLCRQEIMDPRLCVKYGHKVTDCGIEFFKKVKNTCKDELEWYNRCLDFSAMEPCFRKCRREQALFDSCMYDSGFERAKYGHFQLIRVHEPEWERPKKTVPLFPGSVESWDYYNPKTSEKGPHGTGGRYMWQTWFSR